MMSNLTLLATDAGQHAIEAEAAPVQPLPKRVREIIDGIKLLVIEQPTALVIPYSAGKDSTVVVSLATAALRELSAEGLLEDSLEHIVLSADTGVENPLVTQLMRAQHRAIQDFAVSHDLPLTTRIIRPSLSSSFQVSVLGGRRIMPTFGMGSGCSVDWKVQPAQKAVKQHLAELPRGVRAVTLLGSRTDESRKRSQNLVKQGARCNVEAISHDGQWLAYPIIDFTAEDVFNYLLMSAPTGPLPTFREDQGDVLRLYANSSSGCALLATDNTAGGLQTCSARTGCFTCQVNGQEDGSLQSLVETVAPHLQPLVDFRSFLHEVSQRPQYRNYIGTERNRDGKVSMGAKGYAGWILLEMVRFLLSADADEAERAARVGEKPAFQTLGITDIMAIDFWWSIRGLQKRPFEALRAWKAVHEHGERFSLPSSLDDVPATLHRMAPMELPELPEAMMNSLETPIHTMFGVTIGAGERLSVDLESAVLFTELIADDLLNNDLLTLPAAAQQLTSIGIVTPYVGHRSQLDERLALVAHLSELGWLDHAFHGGLPAEALASNPSLNDDIQPSLFTN